MLNLFLFFNQFKMCRKKCSDCILSNFHQLPEGNAAKICDLKPFKLLLEMHVLLRTLDMQSILNRILMPLLIAFKSFRISDIHRFCSPWLTRSNILDTYFSWGRWLILLRGLEKEGEIIILSIVKLCFLRVIGKLYLSYYEYIIINNNKYFKTHCR